MSGWAGFFVFCFIRWVFGIRMFFPQLLGRQLVNQFSLGSLVVALQPLCLCFTFVQLDFFPHFLLGATTCMVSLLILLHDNTITQFLISMEYPIKPLPCLRATAMSQGYCIHSMCWNVSLCGAQRPFLCLHSCFALLCSEFSEKM